MDQLLVFCILLWPLISQVHLLIALLTDGLLILHFRGPRRLHLICCFALCQPLLRSCFPAFVGTLGRGLRGTAWPCCAVLQEGELPTRWRGAVVPVAVHFQVDSLHDGRRVLGALGLALVAVLRILAPDVAYAGLLANEIVQTLFLRGSLWRVWRVRIGLCGAKGIKLAAICWNVVLGRLLRLLHGGLVARQVS